MINMKNVMNVIKDKFKEIYFNSLFRYLNGFTRNFRLSLVLIMINYFQQLSLTTFSYLNQHQTSEQAIFWSILSDFMGYFSLQISVFKDYLNYTGIFAGGFYLILFSLIIFRGIFFEINAKKTQFTLFEVFVSFILKMQYILYYPFAILYSLIILGNSCYYYDSSDLVIINNSTLNIVFSLFGFALQFGIKMMASYHDIEIRFKFDDQLSRPITYFFVHQSLLETISIIVFATKKPIALYIFQILQGSITILEYNRSHIFLQQSMNKLYVSLQYTIILINLLLLIENSFFQPNLIGLLIFFILTISIKISQGMEFYKKSNNYIKSNPVEFQFGDVECYIRSIWNYSSFSINEYLSNWIGIHFETLKQQHILRCVKATCFCQKFQKINGDIEKETVLRQKFFKQNVLNIFQLYLQAKNKLSSPKSDNEYNVLRFSYLAYMIDVLENPLISLPYITKLNNLSFNPREQIILFLLQQQVNMRFSKIVFRKEKEDWSQVIYFDASLEILQQKMIDILSKVKSIIALIGLEYFSIKILKQMIEEVRKLQHEIESLSIKLFNYNQFNKKLQELLSIYLNQFDFRRKIFKKYLNFQQRHLQKEKDFLLLVTNSCIIFSSLLKPLGIVKSYTSNTKAILEDIDMTEIVGQNCTKMIPEQIALHHDKILRNFIENGKIDNLDSVGSDYYRQSNNQKGLFFFSNLKNSFIQPVKMIFQMSQISVQDFGVCSLISKDDLMSDYILLDIENRKTKNMFVMTHMTKRVYNTCLKKICKDESIARKLDVMLMMPEVMILMLDYIKEAESEQKQKRNSFINNIQSLMFYPLLENQVSIFKFENVFHNAHGSAIQLYKELCNEEDIGICEIETRWNHFYISSTSSYVYFLEIIKLKPIKRFSERVITINQFRNKLQNNYSIDLSNLDEVCGFQKLKSFKTKAASRMSIVQPKMRISQISQFSNQLIQPSPNSSQSEQNLRANEHSSQSAFNQNIVPSIVHYSNEEMNINSSIAILNINNPLNSPPIDNKKYFDENIHNIIHEENQEDAMSNNTNAMNNNTERTIMMFNQESKDIAEMDIQKDLNSILSNDVFNSINNGQANTQAKVRKSIFDNALEKDRDFSFMNISNSKLKQNSDSKMDQFSFQNLPKQLSNELMSNMSKRISLSIQMQAMSSQLNHPEEHFELEQQTSSNSQQKSLLNLMIYSSSNRMIEEQKFKSKRKQSISQNKKQQIETENNDLNQIEQDNEGEEQPQSLQYQYEDEGKENDLEDEDGLFQIDEDADDYQTEDFTQTQKHTSKSKKSTDRQVSEQKKNSLEVQIEDLKNIYQQQNQIQKQNSDLNQLQEQRSNLSIVNHFADENHKIEGEEPISPIEVRPSQQGINSQQILMPSKKSDNQIGYASQSKKLIRPSLVLVQNNHNCPFNSYLPQFRNQYTDFQAQEINNNPNNMHDDIMKKKSLQQTYYNSHQYFKQFGGLNNQRYSVQNYLNPEIQSNLDQSTSQLQQSFRNSNNEIEDDDMAQSEIQSQQFHEDLYREHNNNNDNTSAASSKNEINQKKKKIIQLIYSPFDIKSLNLMKVISLMLLLGLLLTVSFNYLSIKIDVNNCQDETINIKTMGDILLYESLQIQSKTFKKLNNQYQFSGKGIITDVNITQIEADLLQSYQSYQHEIQVLNELTNSNQLQSVLISTLSNVIDFNENNQNLYLNKSLSYDLQRRIESYFIYQSPNLMINEELQIHVNFLIMTETILGVLNTVYSGLNNILNSTFDSLLLAFTLSIAMSILNVTILVPIHIVGISILDGQLKICSHFSREKLQSLYSRVSKIIYSSVLQTKDYSQPKSATKISNHISGKNIQWKKKASSHTDSLQLFNFKFISFIILLFILLTVYPIFNYVYGSKFISELQQILNKLEIMEQSRICIIISSGILNLKLNSIVYDYAQYSNTYVTQTFPSMLDQLQANAYNNQTLYVQQMKQEVSYFNDYSLIMHDQLSNAFLNPLQNDLCGILSTSFYTNLTISSQECPDVFNQYLQKGLVFLLTDLYQQQENLYTSLKQVKSSQDINNWLEINNFVSYILKERMINYIYLDISNTILNSVEEMINFVILLQYYMFLYAIFQIFLVQFIFQMKHFSNVSKRISKSKLIFSIFQVDFVLENSYFLSYFKNKLKFKI